MKRFFVLVLVTLISACTEANSNSPSLNSAEPAIGGKLAPKTAVGGCNNIKGVVDSDLGKVYYPRNHKLFQHVVLVPRNGDRYFCSESDAQRAGFDQAPRYFNDSTAKLIDCLESESESGKCHNYIRGIYQSLLIYDKICGTPNIASSNLVGAVVDYAKRAPNGLDMSRYDGTARAMLKKFSCS